MDCCQWGPPPLHTPSQQLSSPLAALQGLPLSEIDTICRPLSDLLDVMQLDTGLVMQNLKQVGG